MDVRSAPAFLPATFPVFVNDTRHNGNPNIYLTKFAYRIFSDGHAEDIHKTMSYPNVTEFYNSGNLATWYLPMPGCLQGQSSLAMDPESDPYRDEDGSIVFPPFLQADFMLIPKKYSDEFIKAAAIHSKHDVYMECAYGSIVDMMKRKSDVTVRDTNLCTTFRGYRGGDVMNSKCYFGDMSFGISHPWKISVHGYHHWSGSYDWMQTSA